MPKKTPHIPLPGIQLDAAVARPLYRQLYDQLRESIRSQYLAPGTRLPSTRALAEDLGVSRTTVAEAYQDLRAEGYIEGQIGAGTYVARLPPERFLHTKTAKGSTGDKFVGPSSVSSGVSKTPGVLSQRGSLLAQTVSSSGIFSGEKYRTFRIGLPALDAFPYQGWTRILSRTIRHASLSSLDYQDSAGYRPLREAIAAYVNIARGVRCTADQVIIVAGAQRGLSLTSQLLLNAGDAVWMEDPGYPWAKAAFRSVGATMIPVPIDGEGMNVAVGRARNDRARLAYVTPSHQFPLGITMSLLRRYELLRWAQQANAWIIEDDYDSEYRYSGRPIPALQGLDEAGRTIYLGTFSKVLFPALRLGYVVAPPQLIDAFIAAQRITDIHPPIIEQIAVATFMVDGHLLQHIRRMRALYARRGEFLRACASQYLGNVLDVERPFAGLHLVGWLPEGTEDLKVANLAKRQGIDVSPLSAYRMEPDKRSGVLLGFAPFTEHEITEGIHGLVKAWA